MRIYRPSHKDTKGERVHSKRFWLKFRDHTDTLRLFPGFSDRKLTERLGQQLERLVAYHKTCEPLSDDLRKFVESLSPKDRDKLINWGLIDQRTSSSGKPLSEHIEDFCEFLEAKSEKRARAVTSKLTRIVKGCGFVSYSDINASYRKAVVVNTGLTQIFDSN